MASAPRNLTVRSCALIQAGIGEWYFVNDHIRLRAQHFSDAALDGSNRNFALNTPRKRGWGLSWDWR
jgi:hypothetical protein